jgi:deoxyadenosine/deoxycytidine kinase
MPGNKPFVVSVEGNIGSGKSTMLKHFDRMTDVELLPEPVDEWCNLRGHNLLSKLYEDPARWSFQFQSYIQLTRLKLLRSDTTKKVKILERSIQNNRFCFLELAKREGTLSDPELSVLYSWYDWLGDSMGLDLDLIVYLRTCPKVAYERMQTRGREEESGAPYKYLENLHQVYEDWLIHQSFGKLDVPVLVLDADKDLDGMLEMYIEYQDEICGRKGTTLGGEKKRPTTSEGPTTLKVPKIRC